MANDAAYAYLILQVNESVVCLLLPVCSRT